MLSHSVDPVPDDKNGSLDHVSEDATDEKGDTANDRADMFRLGKEQQLRVCSPTVLLFWTSGPEGG